jgi:hypothetical protein
MKLTFLPHIIMPKHECLKTLNILKSVSSTDWGADSTVSYKSNYHTITIMTGYSSGGTIWIYKVATVQTTQKTKDTIPKLT